MYLIPSPLLTLCLLSKEKEIEIVWSLVNRGMWECDKVGVEKLLSGYILWNIYN